MKRLLSIFAAGLLGAWAVSAQTPASAQAGASAQAATAAQSEGSAQAGKSGAKAGAGGSASTSESASANAGSNSVSISSGTKIDATLISSLDAKRSKVGDRVEARAAQDVKQDGKVVLKRGTHLIGHVTQAQARASGQAQSQLGVAFDYAVLSGGKEAPFSAAIQAIAAAQTSTAASAGPDDLAASGAGRGSASGSTRGGGGLVGGVASTAGAATGTVMNTATSASSAAGGTVNAAARSTGAVGGLTSSGRLESNSSGVFGLEGLSLDTAASSSTQGSLVVSSTKNVRLESGTQLLLSANAQAQ